MATFRFLFPFICVVYSCVFLKAKAQSYGNMTGLMSHVLSGYNPDVLPLNNQSDVIAVNVAMYLYNILEVDTVKETLSVILSISVSWNDEKIRWNPSEFDNITTLLLNSKQAWKPQLVLVQSVELTALGEPWMSLTYQSNGIAHWNTAKLARVTCLMNMQYWPFDTQECEFSFFPYISRSNIEINVPPNEYMTASYTPNGEWVLDKAESLSYKRFDVTEALLKVKLKRRYMFYVLTLILPYLTLGMLEICVFLLPCDSGERVSYSVTILLAQIVFLTVISDNIPKLSDPVPLVCVAILSAIITCSLSTVGVILNLTIYHRSEDVAVGPWYMGLVNQLKRNHMIVGVSEDNGSAVVKNKPAPKDDFQIKTANDKSHSDQCQDLDLQEIVPYGNNSEANKDMKCGNTTWKDVSRAIDSIMFVCVLIGTLLPTGVIILLVILKGN